jgi:SAM-dependent methyltransferase
MIKQYNKNPLQVIETGNRSISIFSTDGKNIDSGVVKTFGEEWLKFKDYSDEEIRSVAVMYFDILNENIINKDSYCLDLGCGTGRWTKYLASKAGFIEAIDPSDAVFAADELLKKVNNVRVTKASAETIPFDDGTFDFAMSIGVLHHIPDTQQAMIDCVKKVKKGGYFYCYLYYNMENRGIVFNALFWLSNILRNVVSKLPAQLKKFSCDLLAVILYMPFVYMSRFFSILGWKKLAKSVPLSDYADKSFFIIRNDSLDRFGTTLEQRFSKQQVVELMEGSGLTDIIISPASPYYHALGKKR